MVIEGKSTLGHCGPKRFWRTLWGYVSWTEDLSCSKITGTLPVICQNDCGIVWRESLWRREGLQTVKQYLPA